MEVLGFDVVEIFNGVDVDFFVLVVWLDGYLC